MRVRLSFMSVQHVSIHGRSITSLAVHVMEPGSERTTAVVLLSVKEIIEVDSSKETFMIYNTVYRLI